MVLFSCIADAVRSCCMDQLRRLFCCLSKSWITADFFAVWQLSKPGYAYPNKNDRVSNKV
ncbi:hypothetical protein OROHE_000130 [Orobanche hederae]